MSYSDSTPSVTFSYDRLGRKSSVTCNGITTTLSYDSANDCLGESYSGGVLNGLSTVITYDSLLRRTNMNVLNGATVIAKTTNNYDAAGRISVISDGTNTATYSYVANSPLVDHIAFKHSSTAIMTSQNTFDYVNRLTGKTSMLGFNYQYNTASQRTKVTLADGSYWLYNYDSLGQLTSGKKYFYDGTPYAGRQFVYAFDTIGNRTSYQAGGDATGANLRFTGYTNNLLNQITSHNVPPYVDVMGLTLATNVVSVNGTNAYQKWEYYREQMGTNNSAARWMGINVTAPGQTTVSGSAYVAENPENLTYDADGNLTQDGRWIYTWDAENRLVNMTNISGAPSGSMYNLAFTYDYMGRRIQKVSTNIGSACYTNRCVYDGWNVEAILDGNNGLVSSFVWGLDLSRTMKKAGGVGGLVCENLVGNGVHFPVMDGNGNVQGLVSATNGSMTANYDFGPFGELTRISGPAAKLNPFMFQTEFYDLESGKYYWKKRYYDPIPAKWLSRDPIEEKGGDNLYAFVSNDGINRFDAFGTSEASDLCILRHTATEWRAKSWQFAANLLTTFYTQTAPYTPSQYDINLIKNSDTYKEHIKEEMFDIFDTLQYHGGVGRVAIAKGKSQGPYAFEPQYAPPKDSELFYALGEAHFYYSGYMIYSVPGGWWRAFLTVTQEDDYTFKPTGPKNVRLNFPSYAAGHDLEMNYGFIHFWHSETWSDTIFPF